MLRWIAVFVFIIFSPAAFAEPVFPPGSRIGLEPPPEMELSKRFSGFEDADRATSITIVEMPPEAFPQVAADLSKEQVKRQGLRERSRQNFKVGESEAILVSGVQTANGQKVGKWILAISDSEMTGFVIAQSPDGRTGYSDKDMIKALKSAVIRPPLSFEEQALSLPFTVGDRAGFRIVRVVSGNSIVLTQGPRDNNLEGNQPVVVIGASPGSPIEAKAREAFARQALGSSQNLRNLSIERSEGFRMKGDDWYEIVARATDVVTGRPVVVMQTIRFRDGGYLRMLAMVKAEDREGTLTKFRNIIDSVELRTL